MKIIKDTNENIITETTNIMEKLKQIQIEIQRKKINQFTKLVKEIMKNKNISNEWNAGIVWPIYSNCVSLELQGNYIDKCTREVFTRTIEENKLSIKGTQE